MFYIMIIKQVTNDEGENIEWNGQIIEYKNYIFNLLLFNFKIKMNTYFTKTNIV